MAEEEEGGEVGSFARRGTVAVYSNVRGCRGGAAITIRVTRKSDETGNEATEKAVVANQKEGQRKRVEKVRFW